MQYLRKISGAVAVSLALVGSAGAQDLKLLTGWDESNPVVDQVLQPYIKTLEEASGGKLSISRLGPETIPPFEQLDPVGRGAFDLLFTNGAYHYNDSSVAMAVEALNVTSENLRSSGVFDFVDEHYQDRGLKLIGYLLDQNGYNLMLKEEVGEDGLKGRRIRGTPVYHPVIELLGGAPVVLPASEIYPALERGVVDGAAWPLVGAYSASWFEVSNYLMRPSFGRVGYPIFMNLDRWESLDEETRMAIETATKEFENSVAERFDAMVAEEMEALENEGMEITMLPDDLRDKLAGAWFEGVMALAAKQNQESIDALRGIAEKADLTP
jgi:TRAP-type C4-dicarboxylate transport system substrate-binding protein